MNQSVPSWAQAADANAMGLDLGDEQFADFLNPEYLNTDFTNFDGLDNSANVTQHPFGDSLVQSSSQDAFQQSFFNATSRPPTSNAPVPQTYGQPHTGPFGAFPQGQFVQQAPGDAFDQAMRGTLPTPNSSEMYAKNFEYFHHQQQQMRQQQPQRMQQAYSRSSTDLATYTPFESPGIDGSQSAVSFVPDYNPPGNFALSPISSPAMNPQFQAHHTPRSGQMTAAGSAADSPASERLDQDGEAGTGAEERPRKTRKKAGPTTRSTTTSARGRKNTTNASSRKNSLSLRIPPRGSSGPGSAQSLASKDRLDAQALTSAPRSNGSGSNSISPRPANEAVMAPPPKPASAVSTPTQAIPRHSAVAESPNPATPASMMRTRTPGRALSGKATASGSAGPQHSPSSSMLESGMEFLRLPEAADDTAPQNSADRVISNVAPATQMAESNTASESPMPTSTVASPTGPTGTSKGGRGSKKRNSSSSNLVSPALRPKVSPSVKPLLPEGSGMDSQTQALLLASRSNYENILSGNHLPGVNYPAELGANLTSKRTSHKLAEQGRRNRINDALKEMQTLLPARFASKVEEEEAPPPTNAKGGKKNANATSTQTGNSKAATVENAIEYIKVLQKDMEQKDSMIKQLNEENKGLKSKTKAAAIL